MGSPCPRSPHVFGRGPTVPELTWTPTIVDIRGEATAYGARRGRERFVRVPHVADFSWHSGAKWVTTTPHPDAEPDSVTDAIRAVAIPLFLQDDRSYEVLHASAVAMDIGLIGLCGSSGQGKSTLAHGLALHGLPLWADDLLAFRVDQSGAVATALPFDQNLRASARDFFQGSVLSKSRARRAVAWSRTRLQALFVLAPVPDGSRVLDITPLQAADAMSSLLPHGMRLLPLDKARERRILTAYVDLIASVPIYRVTYTQEFAHLPALLDCLEHEARESVLAM